MTTVIAPARAVGAAGMPGMIVLLLVLLYPIGWLVSTSFKPADEVLSSLSLLPEHGTSGNYRQVFGGIAGIGVWRFFPNSLDRVRRRGGRATCCPARWPRTRSRGCSSGSAARCSRS